VKVIADLCVVPRGIGVSLAEQGRGGTEQGPTEHALSWLAGVDKRTWTRWLNTRRPLSWHSVTGEPKHISTAHHNLSLLLSWENLRISYRRGVSEHGPSRPVARPPSDSGLANGHTGGAYSADRLEEE